MAIRETTSNANTHPLYGRFILDWELMSDSFVGQRKVKDKGTTYLPATPGQVLDGMQTNQPGWKNYVGYRERAVFPDFVSSAVEALLGIMHHKPATIELPESMEGLRENATIKGNSLQLLLRTINEHQLTTGRICLISDIPDTAPVGVLPYIAWYKAKDLLNWDDSTRDDQARQELNLIVLDESKNVREGLKWKWKKKARVLTLNGLGNEPDRNLYEMAVVDSDSGNISLEGMDLIAPSVAGRTLDKLPAVVINARDIVADPDDPPLLGLANLGMTVYRAEADYRQNLFMQGQETLVIIGGAEEDVRAGAGAVVNIPQGGDAKYVGVSAKGLKEMREALINDRKIAGEAGGKLLDTTGGGVESGEALRIRVTARTASLNQIATTGAEGLQTILRIIAEWIGAKPEDVKVTANLDFADDSLEGDTLVKWMTAKTLGLPWSKESIHRKLQEKDFTELGFEEEMERIEQEGDVDGGDGTGLEDEDQD